ncbi:hypothetical protein SHLO109777_19560 [Shewanella loihica]|uniref:hypothetical protein n=1 Tax=Shewanella loihica TaxID=359303 RepID=UPI00059C659B|nr:hypothetical protein [Shewanella loihica]
MRIVLTFIKWFVVLTALSLTLWFLVSFAVYRIPSKAAKAIFVGEVHYKFVELSIENRELFENLLGNRIVRLEGHPVLYVSEAERSQLWLESPHDMSKKGYTLKATLTAPPLLLGGYGQAELIHVEVINKEPILSK